jgi:hypothetical protein
MFKLPSVVSDHLAEAPNSYSCSPALFLALMQSFSLKPMSMSEQIIDTKDGILTFLAGRGSPENAIFD